MTSLRNIKRYIWILKNFKQSFGLIKNLRSGGLLADGPPLAEAKFRNGQRIQHPPHRAGLIGTILEIWYENDYRIGSFYTPQKGDTIIDIGAHVGLFSLFIAKQQAECEVISIEASHENYPCLESNVKGTENIKAHHLAVGAEPGWIKMLIKTNRSIDAQVCSAEKGEDGATEVVTLEHIMSFSDNERISLLKMDIEGAEYPIFKSIKDSTLSKIDRLCMEYHDNLKPGILALLKERLEPTHNLEIYPNGDSGHGMLFAKIKD